MKITLHPITLVLREPFIISRSTYHDRKALVVELSAAGKSGFGEASEHAYYRVDRDELQRQAEALRPVIEDYAFDNPANFWSHLQPHLRKSPFLQSALDNAAHDLYGKLSRQPSHRIWHPNGNPGPLPATSFTLGMDDLDRLVEKVRTLRFRTFKIKLGGPDDLLVVETLRRHTDAVFTVDANCAWTAEETLRKAVELKKLGVAFIEQPLPAHEWNWMRELYSQSPLPLVADEACRTEEDVEKCVGCFHGINIKLMKCGGLTPALRMIRHARELDLKVMAGCMIESSVGIAAVAQLLSQLDFIDMDSPLLLKDDPASGPTIDPDGTVQLPAGHGLGIVFPRPDAC
ncbi:MAG: hypothetical protein RLY31_3045 [Bacteroidota bacterium]|jgi:L-alanine-DL-glutamate epimerase-like enolase superfamily enzyme